MRPSDLAPGQRVHGHAGAYTLDRLLGAGGFGATWLARRDGDGKEVAIKALSLDRVGDWKALELFEREGKVLAELSHPGIPRVHELFVSDGARPLAAGEAPPAGVTPRWFIVQDFVAGRSLRQLAQDRGRLDDGQAAALLRGLLDVLDYLHSRRPPVIHRDIHPGNVILGPDGAPRLVDFGAIQDRPRGEGGGSTTIGTVGYAPLEQLMGRARPASDLYALGVTLLVALTHQEPEHLPIDEATGKVAIDVAAPGLAPGLRRALSAMLEPIAGQRAQSAAEVRALLDGPGQAVARRGEAAPAATRAAGPWPTIGGALIGGSLLAAGVLYIALFDMFSETMLVRLSVFWVCGLATGLGIRAAGERHPLVNGLLWGGVAAIALVVFIFAIFPSL